MSIRSSQGGRRAVATLALVGTLAVQAYAAISGGVEAGNNCWGLYPSAPYSIELVCCQSQCQTIHPITSDPKFDECTSKCTKQYDSHVPVPVPTPIPIAPTPPIIT